LLRIDVALVLLLVLVKLPGRAVADHPLRLCSITSIVILLWDAVAMPNFVKLILSIATTANVFQRIL
jgi:hypothetical protein